MLFVRGLCLASAALSIAACAASQPPVPDAPPPPPPDTPVASGPVSEPAIATEPGVATAGAPTAGATADADGCFDRSTAPADVARARRSQALSQDALWKGLGAPPAEQSSCQTDADCAVVEVGCCDHCNGGRLVAANAQHATAIRAKYAPKSCSRACTERGCANGVPLCTENKCTFYAAWTVSSTCGDKGMQ